MAAGLSRCVCGKVFTFFCGAFGRGIDIIKKTTKHFLPWIYCCTKCHFGLLFVVPICLNVLGCGISAGTEWKQRKFVIEMFLDVMFLLNFAKLMQEFF
jgi:hypothetical protein